MYYYERTHEKKDKQTKNENSLTFFFAHKNKVRFFFLTYTLHHREDHQPSQFYTHKNLCVEQQKSMNERRKLKIQIFESNIICEWMSRANTHVTWSVHTYK